MKTNLKKVVSSVLILVVCAGLFSGCADGNLALKNAFNAESNALSFVATTSISFAINDRILDRGETSFSDIFGYAQNSRIKLINKVFINPGKQSGIISTDVEYRFAKSEKDNERDFKFHIDTTFDISGLTKESQKMKLVQIYSTKSVPTWLEKRLPNEGKDKYFVLDLSENQIIKDYLIKLIGKKAPNVSSVLATLNWTRLNEKSFKLNLTDLDIKSMLSMILDSSLLSPLEEQDERIWNNALNTFIFKNTTLKYDLENGRFKTKNWSFNIDYSYYKLMNTVLGRLTGRQVTVPLIIYANTTYDSWNDVGRFYPPTLTTDNQVLFSTLPIKDILPKFYDLPALYTEDKIIVNINGEKVDFLEAAPPIIYNDRIMLPMKYMFETQGISLSSREINGVLQASAMIGIKSVTVTKDSNLASVMGQTIELPCPVGIAYDTFYIPISLFAECFDMQEPVSEVKLMPDGSNMFTINFVKNE